MRPPIFGEIEFSIGDEVLTSGGSTSADESVPSTAVDNTKEGGVPP